MDFAASAAKQLHPQGGVFILCITKGGIEMRYSRRYKCPHCGVKGRLGINPERVQRCRQCGNGFLLEEAFHKEQPKGSGFLERKPNPAINNFQI